jgi:hypothetical protein
LDRLSKQLRNPEVWLLADSWVESTPRAYDPRAFALLLRTEALHSELTSTIEALTATWPFSIGPLLLGDALPASAGPEAEMTRCSVVTKDDMAAVMEALSRADSAATIVTLPDGMISALFAAQDHTRLLRVTALPLLPDRSSCKDLYISF